MLLHEINIGWAKLSPLDYVCTKGMNTIEGI